MDKIRQNVFPIITALIWGTAFSAQSQCAAAGMGAFTFNMLRSVIGCCALAVVLLIFSKGKIRHQLHDRQYAKNLLLGGLCCGVILAAASNFQQLGLAVPKAARAALLRRCILCLCR